MAVGDLVSIFAGDRDSYALVYPYPSLGGLRVTRECEDLAKLAVLGYHVDALLGMLWTATWSGVDATVWSARL